MTDKPQPPPHCPVCGQILTLLPRQRKGGRPRIYCKNSCKQRAYRLRLAKRKAAQTDPPNPVECTCGMGSATMPGPLHSYDCPLGPSDEDKPTDVD